MSAELAPLFIPSTSSAYNSSKQGKHQKATKQNVIASRTDPQTAFARGPTKKTAATNACYCDGAKAGYDAATNCTADGNRESDGIPADGNGPTLRRHSRR